MKDLNCARSGKSAKEAGNSQATVHPNGKAPGSDKSEDLPEVKSNCLKSGARLPE